MRIYSLYLQIPISYLSVRGRSWFSCSNFSSRVYVLPLICYSFLPFLVISSSPFIQFRKDRSLEKGFFIREVLSQFFSYGFKFLIVALRVRYCELWLKSTAIFAITENWNKDARLSPPSPHSRSYLENKNKQTKKNTKVFTSCWADCEFWSTYQMRFCILFILRVVNALSGTTFQSWAKQQERGY